MWMALLKSMRPRQWVKNGFIFFALIFDRKLTSVPDLLVTLGGFVLFCLLSSAVYLINDIGDIEADRQHPKKRDRPLASGKLPVQVAWLAVAAILTLIFPLSLALSPRYYDLPVFSIILALYFLINLAYTRWLKHVAIIDVMVLASFYVLRVAAGVALIQVERFSPWLYVVTTLLALFIGLGKRRAELALMNQNANSHRKVLDGYTIPFLDQLINMVSGITIIAYSLYTFSAPNLPENHAMMLTIPFVVYGIFRYLHLLQVDQRLGAPEELALTDRPLQITMGLWIGTVLLIFYFS
jgi:4-hydroxybenzoate polyprenyltransferase